MAKRRTAIIGPTRAAVFKRSMMFFAIALYLFSDFMRRSLECTQFIMVSVSISARFDDFLWKYFYFSVEILY